MKKMIVVLLIVGMMIASTLAIAIAEEPFELPSNIVDFGDGIGLACLDTKGNVYDYNNGELQLAEENVKSLHQGFSLFAFKEDGSVVKLGDGNRGGTCNYSFDDEWHDIVMADGTYFHAVGVRADGTMVTAGEYHQGQCDVEEWTDIIDIQVGEGFTVGLKKDGTVLATGDIINGKWDFSNWSYVTSIAVTGSWVMGLKSDGTVLITGADKEEQSIVEDWKDVVYITSAAGPTPIGITSEGQLLTTGRYFFKDYSIPKDFRFKDVQEIIFDNLMVIFKKTDGSMILFGRDDRVEIFKDRIALASEKAASMGVPVSSSNDSIDSNINDNSAENTSTKQAALKKGSKGEMVKKLQERLNELGYSVGKADGSYGNKTKAAIEEFQADNHIAVTGEADSSTQELLYSDDAMSKEEASLARGIVEFGNELSKLDANGDGELSEDEIFING